MRVTASLHGSGRSAALRNPRPDCACPQDRSCLNSSAPGLGLIKPMYPLVGGAIQEEKLPGLMEKLPGWNLRRVDGLPRLERQFVFSDFKQAMAFSNEVAEFAEAQGHHPTLLTEWGKVTVGWWTHDVGGVHANDFVSAGRTEAVLAQQEAKRSTR